MLRRLASLLPCLFLLAACGAKSTTPGPVDSLCTAGTFQCFGNVSAACAAGGKSYDVTQCGVDKFCNAATGKCEGTVCEKGSSKCVGSDSSNICNADGSAVTYGRAFGRYWGQALSSLILGIGFLMVAFDDEKRGLHDRLCDTRVIRK